MTSKFSFEFPMYIIEKESKKDFNKRCIDTAVQLMKQDISSGIAKKNYLPYKREGHKLTEKERWILFGSNYDYFPIERDNTFNPELLKK